MYRRILEVIDGTVFGSGAAQHRRAIQPGYPVFARPDNPANEVELGRFVGVVDEVIESHSVPYLRVRGGLEQARELCLPLAAVRAAENHQIRLNLNLAEVVGRA